jgi:hypothetical protein
MISWNVSRRAPLAAAVLLGAGVGHAQDSGPIDPERLSQIVKVLASDEFAGRAPGGPGEKKTLDNLISQFKAVGLDFPGKAEVLKKVEELRAKIVAGETQVPALGK